MRFLLFVISYVISSFVYSQHIEDAFSASVQYRVPINNNKINSSGHGLSFEGSIGLTKIIFDKDYISVFGGVSFREGFYKTTFKEEFKADFDNAINTSLNGLEGEAVSRLQHDFHYLQSARVPLPSYHEGWHEKNLYYGLILGTDKVKLPVLKLYTGITTTVGGISVSDSCISPGHSGQTEYGFHKLKRPLVYGINITQRDVLALFGKEMADRIARLSFSIYYEMSNFSETKYKYWSGCEEANLGLNDFVTDSFKAKYTNNDIRFGFKVGFWFNSSI